MILFVLLFSMNDKTASLHLRRLVALDSCRTFFFDFSPAYGLEY